MTTAAALRQPTPSQLGGGTTPSDIARRGHPRPNTLPSPATKDTKDVTTNSTITEPACAAPTRKKTRRSGRRRTRRTSARTQTPYTHELLADVRREKARFEITLGAIKASLEEEPSPAAIRACARRWERALHAIADEVIAARQNQEKAA